MGQVGILKAEEYNYEKVLTDVDKLLSELDVLKNIKHSSFLVKTNLLKKNKPEDGVTTHPYVVEGVVRFLQSKGHSVVVGDSPGGPFNPVMLKSVYDASGISAVAERTGCSLNYDTSIVEVKPPKAKVINNLKLVKAFTEVDYVVSCAKLKTHTMMTYTGAVKNLFGMIPGVTKADYHLKMNDVDNFANMLIDVCDYVRPLFSVIDGIQAMEGDGPSSGDIRELGLLLAGENPYELDYVATGITGLLASPVNRHALDRGLLNPEKIVLYGLNINDLQIEPFKLPGSTHVNFVSGRIPEFVKDFLLESIRPYPEVINKICVGCGVCAANCPPKVISMRNHKAVIDTTDCIRCFCCHELCPEKAIKVKRHPIHRMVFGK
ncbi:DUF362 domain-containing protein [Gudongella sp. DL1XJH-153]|uniref:DUF362 domain-containing protein n=1 Tax=Gudongella sp. DL1XJH-153 TaxID=3409804 RepID=UPI003BB555A0